jgi:hypothetical protein
MAGRSTAFHRDTRDSRSGLPVGLDTSACRGLASNGFDVISSLQRLLVQSAILNYTASSVFTALAC